LSAFPADRPLNFDIHTLVRETLQLFEQPALSRKCLHWHIGDDKIPSIWTTVACGRSSSIHYNSLDAVGTNG
jgi:hypothetical protein